MVMAVDKRNKLEENVFDYQITKNNKAFIFWKGKHVTTLSGKHAEKFITDVAKVDCKSAQLIMAKVTGHFKHGNERHNGL